VNDPSASVECVSWRVRATGVVKRPSSCDGAEPFARATNDVHVPRRRVRFHRLAWTDSPVFRADRLTSGSVIEGPAIVEDAATTIVVQPGSELRVSPSGDYLLTPAARPLRLNA